MNIKDILSKIILNIGTKGLSILFALILQVLLARLLSPTEYGNFVLIQIICVGLATFSQSGMNSAYMKLVLELECNQGLKILSQMVAKIILKKLFIAFIFYLIISIFLFKTTRINEISIFVSFCLFFIALTFINFMLGWFRATDRAHISSLAEQGLYSSFTLLFIFLWLNIFEKDVNLAIASFFLCISSLLTAFIISKDWVNTVRKSSNLNLEINESYIKKLSNRFLVIQIATYIANWSGILVVGILLTAEEVGLLNSAQRVGQIIIFFLLAFNGVIAPKFAQHNNKNNLKEVRKLAQLSTNLLALITIPLTIIIIFYGKEILLLFGEEYVVGYPLLVIIMFGQTINAMTGSVGILLSMTNYENIQRNIVISTSIVSVSFALIGTYFFGVNGAAAALSFSTILSNLTSAYFVYRKLGFICIPRIKGIV